MNNELPLLLEPQQLAALLPSDNILLVDLSRAQIYRQAHLPNAIHLDFKKTQRTETPVGLLPDISQLEALLSELGLRDDLHVVAYDDEGGGWAGRFLWLLESVGHTSYSYLNGGIHAWLAEDLPYEEGAAIAKRSDYRIKAVRADVSVDIDYLLKHHADGEHIIWDARSLDEYNGVRVFAQKGGHIPGAIQYEWTEALDGSESMRLKPKAQLLAELSARGIDMHKRVVVHCHTHHRSGLSWLVGKYLEFNDVRAYPGSWSEWGNHPATPIACAQ